MCQDVDALTPHATGSKEAIYGTNPICISVPTAGGAPVTMDMATSAYAWYGVLQAQTAGEQLPEGVALNAAGEPTTDPDAVLAGGALRSFDRSHKGSNLGLMVELLAGMLFLPIAINCSIEASVAMRSGLLLACGLVSCQGCLGQGCSQRTTLFGHLV